MTTNPRAAESWVRIGSSETSPTENKIRAQVFLDSYYVVVGFEVNDPKAFKDDIQDLSVDYGHAFFYLVKNLVIKKSFSFGPNGPGKHGLFNTGRVTTYKKDGRQNGRPATADYSITEPVKAFKISIAAQQAVKLEREIDKIRAQIYAGSVEYSALMNDTCAETAKEVLDDADVETPSGSGWVKHSGMLRFPLVYAANPYKWHKNFKASHSERNFDPGALGEWIPVPGERDPIFGAKK